ncbi:CoA-binding protein, partial [Neisseria sp. P0022.S009]|uniref:CoA-binding protein n=1 Tax=Neisseria sp. P0022.S009 TaxID=3436834 RepID=UPI003F8139A5
RPHSLGERICSHLLGSSYQGKITPVNLRHSSVAGLPSYSSLSKIPGQADLGVAVIPHDHYDTLFKACRKKGLRHIILIQNWENLPPESCKNARSIIQKYHGDELNISVCNSAGGQLPSLNLNIGTQADYPAGHIALLTGHSTVSRNINHLLNT